MPLAVKLPLCIASTFVCRGNRQQSTMLSMRRCTYKAARFRTTTPATSARFVNLHSFFLIERTLIKSLSLVLATEGLDTSHLLMT
jgi:hypothetical protein